VSPLEQTKSNNGNNKNPGQSDPPEVEDDDFFLRCVYGIYINKQIKTTSSVFGAVVTRVTFNMGKYNSFPPCTNYF
jgi:hypothetical protein